MYLLVMFFHSCQSADVDEAYIEHFKNLSIVQDSNSIKEELPDTGNGYFDTLPVSLSSFMINSDDVYNIVRSIYLLKWKAYVDGTWW